MWLLFNGHTKTVSPFASEWERFTGAGLAEPVPKIQADSI
jgi:hypothetical protein